MPELSPSHIQIYPEEGFAQVSLTATRADDAGRSISLEISVPINDLNLTPAQMTEQAMAKAKDFLGLT